MQTGDTPFRDSPVGSPADVLQNFVGAFESKGWLDQTIRIKHRNRRYRLFCSKREFFAYRINDHWGVPPGFPGWFVCIVTHDDIIEDSKMSDFATTEPGVHDWLHCIADDDFERI